MDSVIRNNTPRAISSSGCANDGHVVNGSQAVRGLFRLRGGSKSFRQFDRSDMEQFETKQVDLPKPKHVALSGKSSVPPHLLMTALLEQLCHMYVPADKGLANRAFKMLCESLSKLNVISPLSHLDEMRHLRKQHSVTFKRLLGAALHTIKQNEMARAIQGQDPVPSPIPNRGERILLQERLMDECSSRYEDEFEELGHLGSGGFGSVYKVKNNLDKRCYAIKKIRFKQKNHELLHKLLREVRVLAKLQHINIVGYNGAWIESHDPFTSSKGTSSENTASHGISVTDSPRDRKANDESQSVEFLDDPEDRPPSRNRLPPSRMSLQYGARIFSRVKDTVCTTTTTPTPTSTTTTTTAHCTKTTADVVSDHEHFNLYNFNFSQCRITEITELSSSQCSSSSLEDNWRQFKNGRIKTNVRKTECKFKASSVRVTEIESDSDDDDVDDDDDDDYDVNDDDYNDDNELLDNGDDRVNNSDVGVESRAVKRSHQAMEMNRMAPLNSGDKAIENEEDDKNDDDDDESQVSSTGFSVSNSISHQMSLTSDASTDIPNSSLRQIAVPGDYLASYFDDVPSDDSAQNQSAQPPTNLPLFLPDFSILSPTGVQHVASLADCKEAKKKTPLDENEGARRVPSHNATKSCDNPCPFLDSSSKVSHPRGTDLNSNNEMSLSKDNLSLLSSSRKSPPRVCLQGGQFCHPPKRCGSYSGVESTRRSVDDDLDPCPWDLGIRHAGKSRLKPTDFFRSFSNFEDGKFRGAGESKDHSYDFQNSIFLYIQMELCHQTLCDWLVTRNETIDLQTAYHDGLCTTNMIVFRQLLNGVDFIHSQKLIHRDLKPRNIFLSENSMHVKIGDFGLAKEELLHLGEEGSMLCSDWLSSDSLEKSHTTGVGTTGYAAPEQIEGSVYDAKSDMYSLGVVLFELFNVFKTDMERMENIKRPRDSGCLHDIRTRWPKQADAICRLTHERSTHRPSASDLLKGELYVSPEQEIKSLKQTILDKDKLIESLRQEILSLKTERDQLFGGFSLFGDLADLH